MKITKVEATCHSVPVKLPLLDKPVQDEFLMVRVETDEGITGFGMGPRFMRFYTKEFINRQLAPFVVGKDPLGTEMLWNRDAHAELGMHASFYATSDLLRWGFGALDFALWDIKGKYLNQPVFRLLGGSSNRIPCYVTIGLSNYSREELAEVSRQFGKTGQNSLKMQVSYTPGKNMIEEEARVRVVREAMGEEGLLMVDANDRFNFAQARELSQRIERYNIGWFESPICMTTHMSQMPALRRSTTIPMGHSGALPGRRWFYRNLIESGAVDILQPNVVYVGGYTEALKIAHLAQAYNMPIATGAGQPLYNMHLIAGVANGWMVECHYRHVLRDEVIYVKPPRFDHGWLTLPEKPGLGLEINEAALTEFKEP